MKEGQKRIMSVMSKLRGEMKGISQNIDDVRGSFWSREMRERKERKRWIRG